MVAHTGFEPVVSSLRGMRPRPLDECALLKGKSESETGETITKKKDAQGEI